MHQQQPEEAYILIKGSRSMQMEKVLEGHKAYIADQLYDQGDVIEDFSSSQILSAQLT